MKRYLTQAPVLAYPDFSTNASQFQLYTDASTTGWEVYYVEQDGKVVAYARRILNQAKRNYIVIQHECLVIIYT